MDLEKEQALFRENLFKFQSDKGYSEVKLSQAIGKSNSYIQSISSGKNMPRFNTFIDICNVLDKDPIEFFLQGENNDYLLDTIHIAETLNERDKHQLRELAERLAAEHRAQSNKASK